jgi:hypothetical protein
MIDPFTIQTVKKMIKEKKEQLVEITSTGVLTIGPNINIW